MKKNRIFSLGLRCRVVFMVFAALFLLAPDVDAKIKIKEEWAGIPYPEYYSDVPWFPTVELACEAVFERRSADWSFYPWGVERGSPFAQVITFADGTLTGEANCFIWRTFKGEKHDTYSSGYAVRRRSCPDNSVSVSSEECECSQGYSEVGNSCEPLPPPPPPTPPSPPPPPFRPDPGPPSCPANPGGGNGNLGSKSGESTPNPILLARAQKYQPEIDYVDQAPHPLTFGRNYLSKRPAGAGDMGGGWARLYADALVVKAATRTDPSLVLVTTDDGGASDFRPRQWRVAA